jgi:hypothetical protein
MCRVIDPQKMNLSAKAYRFRPRAPNNDQICAQLFRCIANGRENVARLS